MRRVIFSSVLILTIFAVLLSVPNLSPGRAQTKPSNDIYLNGTIENDRRMSGFFGKNGSDWKSKNWCVFIGANGKVYKLTLIDRSIGDLYIDGQKIAGGEIWKHTAEYKPFLLKFWRSEEIENESRELERQIKPIDRRMEAINQEIEKLDKAEEKLDRDTQNGAASFADNRKTIDAQRRRLEEIQKELETEIENLSKRQENLSREHESLKLSAELDKVLLKISEDMKSLGIIKTTKNLSFKLSNRELVVNGKQVSAEVFDLLKSRYIVETNGESGYLFRWKGDV